MLVGISVLEREIRLSLLWLWNPSGICKCQTMEMVLRYIPTACRAYMLFFCLPTDFIPSKPGKVEVVKAFNRK